MQLVNGLFVPSDTEYEFPPIKYMEAPNFRNDFDFEKSAFRKIFKLISISAVISSFFYFNTFLRKS